MNKRGYTLTELIVVMVIGALLVGIAIPAFSAIVSSSREGLAQNMLQQAVYAARDTASMNIGGGDAAAVFFYDEDRGLSVGIFEEVGSFTEISGNGGNARRDLFVPVSSMEPAQLPAGFSVRGFVLGTQLRDEDWYEDLVDFSPAPGTIQPGGPGSSRGPGAWVFPETDFFDQTEQDDGRDRQSFMIRFEAGSGALSRDNSTAVILDVRPSSEDRLSLPELESVNQAEDVRSWAVRAVNSIAPSITNDIRSDLIGNDSSDTVLVRPVTDIALYRELRLGQMLGLRGLNRQTGTIYERDDEPTIDAALFRDSTLATDRLNLETKITMWIEGRLVLEDDTEGSADEADSTIYTISSYFGDLVEINR